MTTAPRDHPTSTPPRTVVVAVGTSGSDAAVSHGADLATRIRGPLHLLHVVELVPGAVPLLRPPRDPDAAPGAQVLRRAAVRARSLVGGSVPVSSELAHGEVVARIEASVESAAYVVLEQSDQPAWTLSGGEVCLQVGTRVAVPVVCVPRPTDAADFSSTVTVAVKDPLTGGPLIQEAMEIARATRAPLRVVHVAEASEHRADRDLLTAHLDDLPRSAGGSQVDVVGGVPVSALREASRSAAILVVGRHHRHRTGGGTLGPVARSLARRSACPVLLAPPSRSSSSGEWVFQTDWA